MNAASIATAVRFYDMLRDNWYTERSAREAATLYLCRKGLGLDANGAAIVLAEALAMRAAAKAVTSTGPIETGVVT